MGLESFKLYGNGLAISCTKKQVILTGDEQPENIGAQPATVPGEAIENVSRKEEVSK